MYTCVYLCAAPLFGTAASLGFSASTSTAAAATSAVAPQSAGFTFGGGQTMTTSGLTFGSSSLGAQPQTTNTQTSAALPGFTLPGLPPAAAASTGQPGGFPFGGMQSSSAAAPTLGTGLLTTTSATGFTFGAVPSSTNAANTGLTGLLGTGAQTGSASLFGGVKPGLL